MDKVCVVQVDLYLNWEHVKPYCVELLKEKTYADTICGNPVLSVMSTNVLYSTRKFHNEQQLLW